MKLQNSYIHDRPPKAVLNAKMAASILISSHFLGIDVLVAKCVAFMCACVCRRALF